MDNSEADGVLEVYDLVKAIIPDVKVLSIEIDNTQVYIKAYRAPVVKRITLTLTLNYNV